MLPKVYHIYQIYQILTIFIKFYQFLPRFYNICDLCSFFFFLPNLNPQKVMVDNKITFSNFSFKHVKFVYYVYVRLADKFTQW